MTKTGIEAVIKQIKNGIKFEKCWICGCQQGTVKALLKELPNLSSEDQKLLEPVLNESVATFKNIKYDCKGCRVCFPSVATNELMKVYPDIVVEDESCGGDDKDSKPRDGWPPLPGKYDVNRYQAPVAVCTLNSEELHISLADIRHEHMSIVGTMNTENLGIERVIQNILANPNIRFLILCGPDSEQKIGHLPGQSMVQLMAKGIDEKNRIIGSKGKRPILKNVSREAVEEFRKQIEVINMIGCNQPTNVVKMIDYCFSKNPGPFERSKIVEFKPETITAGSPPRLKLDPAGYFVVFPDKKSNKIVVEHYKNNGALNTIVEGTDVSSIYTTLIEMKLISRLDHCCYLGRELARAELSMKYDIPYKQDKAPDKEEEAKTTACAGSGCC